MSLVPTKTLLEALKAALAAIPVSTQDSTPLFDAVEIYPNKGLATALQDLAINRDRVCLAIPFGYQYTHKELGNGSILARRFLQVDLLIADRAIAMGGIKAFTGGPQNVGILDMQDALVNGISGKELSAYGGVIPDNGAPLEISTKDQQQIPGRIGWAQSVLIPAGTVRALVA